MAGLTGSVGEIEITKDNSKEVLSSLSDQGEKILTMIGIKAEKYAKALCPVGTSESTGIKGYRGGTLRNSITFQVEKEGSTVGVAIGTNVEYAPFVELGTLGGFEGLPPEWESFEAPPSSGLKQGKGIKAKHFLRDAIQNHIPEYKAIIESELKNA